MSEENVEDFVRMPIGVISIYLQGLDSGEIIETVRTRRPPVIPAGAALAS